MEKVINHLLLCSPGFRVPRLEGQLLLADRACLEAGDSLPGWPLVTAASGAILPYHVGPFSHFSNKLSARTDIIRQKATFFEFCIGQGVLKSFYFSHCFFCCCCVWQTLPCNLQRPSSQGLYISYPFLKVLLFLVCY